MLLIIDHYLPMFTCCHSSAGSQTVKNVLGLGPWCELVQKKSPSPEELLPYIQTFISTLFMKEITLQCRMMTKTRAGQQTHLGMIESDCAFFSFWWRCLHQTT